MTWCFLPVRHTGRDAQSLLEVLLGTLLMTLLLFPLIALLTGEIRSVASTRRRTMAHLLARNLVERFRQERVEDLVRTPGPGGTDEEALALDPLLTAAKVPGGRTGTAPEFRRRVSFLSGAPDSGVWELVAEVTYDEGSRRLTVRLALPVFDDGRRDPPPPAPPGSRPDAPEGELR